MIQVTLAFNAIQLEAARRLRRRALAEQAARSPRGPGLRPCLDLLVHEPARMRLTPEDRRLWPLRCPVSRALMLALCLPARLGLVSELRLSHLHRVGRALRLVARHARSLCLLDDGLDQYRSRPRAMEPQAFPADTPCWLFSDAPQFRADWCRRFHCRELGPLYEPPDGRKTPPETTASPSAGTLIIDSPGVEQLEQRTGAWPQPWCLIPHPVLDKRSWRLPLPPGGRLLQQPPEEVLPDWSGVVLVGESLMLLAALRLRPPGSPLLIALPPSVDPNLAALARTLAAGDAAIEVL